MYDMDAATLEERVMILEGAVAVLIEGSYVQALQQQKLPENERPKVKFLVNPGLARALHVDEDLRNAAQRQLPTEFFGTTELPSQEDVVPAVSEGTPQ